MAERRVIGIFSDHPDVDRLMYPDVGQLVKRLVDEDDGDEAREALLGEARDVADQETQLERHDDLQSYHHPESDPETERHERQTVVPEQQSQRKIVFSHFLTPTQPFILTGSIINIYFTRTYYLYLCTYYFN